jgi:hypothetical protein
MRHRAAAAVIPINGTPVEGGKNLCCETPFVIRHSPYRPHGSVFDTGLQKTTMFDMQRNLPHEAVTARRSHLLPAQTVQTDSALPNVVLSMKTSRGSLRLERSSITISTAILWSPGCPTRQICRRSPWRYSLYIVICPCIYRHRHIPSLRLLVSMIPARSP